MSAKKCVIIIPSRLNSQRLPKKALLDIHGKPMIWHVWQKAVKANIGPVFIATCGNEIGDVMQGFGANVVITDPNLPSGTDRVWDAFNKIPNPENFDFLMNLQGDLPNINPCDLAKTLVPFNNEKIDISTLVSPIINKDEIVDENVVKAVLGDITQYQNHKIAPIVYFSRNPVPYAAKNYYHHIGVYAYKKQAIEQFVKLLPCELELTERLEQLRALVDGLRFGGCIVDSIPQSIDTQRDIDLVRSVWNNL